MNSTPLWAVVLVAILGVIGSVVGSRYISRSTVKAAEVDADADAYVRAQQIYKAGQEELEARVKRISEDLNATRAETAEAKAEIRILRGSVSQYEARVLQLQEVLRMHGIPVPPWPFIAGEVVPDPNQPARITPTEET